MFFRQAIITDIEAAWRIICEAKQMMHDKGRDQWTEEYPSLDTIRGDVGSGDAYVLAADGGRVAAYAVITAKPELAYAAIDGKWLTGGRYVVVHRLAVAAAFRGSGLARRMMTHAESLCRDRGVGSIRVDTNHDNAEMLSLLNSLGKVKEDRVYDLILSGGVGLMVNSGNKVNAATNAQGDYNIYSPTLNIGLQNKFRLSDGWDMNIDVKAGWVNNLFDGQSWNGQKTRRGDFFGSVGISFSYRFKPRGTTAYNPDVYINEIESCRNTLEDLESRYNNLVAENERLKDENAALARLNSTAQKTPVATPTEKSGEVYTENRILATIEYPIGSSVLSSNDLKKLREVAGIMKSNPDKTYEICGYADNATGSKIMNIRLRNARANRAIDMLLFYGANRNQILKATNDGELPGTSSRAIVIREVNCE